MSVLWQVGWIVGGLWYAALQATVGFEAGYTVNFITIITLYTIATCLYWIWFRASDRRPVAAVGAAAVSPSRSGPAFGWSAGAARR